MRLISPASWTPWLIALVLAFPVAAQDNAVPDTIPQSIKSSSSIAPSQRETIQAFAQQAMQIMLEGNDQQVVSSRNRLLAEFRTAGASDAFTSALSEELTPTMTEAAAHPRLLIRLNAMIVAGQFTSDGIIDLVKTTIADQSPAVRYWSAKSLAAFAQRRAANLGQAQKNAIIDILKPRIDAEESAPVIREFLRTLMALDSPTYPRAREEMLDALHLRVQKHVGRPNEPHLANTEGIKLLFRQLINDQAEGRNIRDDIRELARVNARFIELVSKQLADGDVIPAQQPGHVELMDIAYKATRWAWGANNGNIAGLPNPQEQLNALKLGRFKQVRQEMINLHDDLQGAPFNFPGNAIKPVPEG